MDGPDAPLVHEYADRSLLGAIAGSHAAATDAREAKTYDVGLWIAIGAALVVGLFIGFLGGVVAEQQRWGFAFTSTSVDDAGAAARNPASDEGSVRSVAPRESSAGAITERVPDGSLTADAPSGRVTRSERAGAVPVAPAATLRDGVAGRAPRGGTAAAATTTPQLFSEAAVNPEPEAGARDAAGSPRPIAGEAAQSPALDRLDRESVAALSAASRATADLQPATRTSRPAATADTGALQVLSRPSGAEVVVDGRVVGRTPLSIPAVRVGAHDVRIELPGFRRWATSVTVTGGDRTRVAASLEQ